VGKTPVTTMTQDLTRTSKFLSLVLRHKPEEIGLTLDANGWAAVDELLTLSAARGHSISRELLHRVVAENDKQRFLFSDDQTRIRASQGHSVLIDLALSPREPPALLYHGTATRFLASIRATGLTRRQRQHVHLSQDEATASQVGTRHGKPAVLIIEAEAMHQAGHPFYHSENGVWLTDSVPLEFIRFPDGLGE